MSSFSGTPATVDASDPGLQLAAPEDEGPDFGTLKEGFTKCISDLDAYRQQCYQNYETRFALWAGQSADGRKHAREGGKVDPTPWDNASDLRVYLTDDAINSIVALECMAVEKANVVAIPVEGNDIKRAKAVSNFMRWIMATQIPELDREMELLSQYVNEKGGAITGQFWETTQMKTLINLDLQQLQEQFPSLDIQQLIFADEATDDLVAILTEIYDCTSKKGRKMIRELRATGKTTVAVVGKERGRPIIRAFNLDENIFIHPSSTDLETAPAIYRVEYFTPETLRSMINTAGWDEAWVEAAILRCRGKLITQLYEMYNQPISRSFTYQEQRFENLIGVVFAYRRLSDEDNVSGIYCTIFNPDLPSDETQPGYAKDGLLGYAHGEQPFKLFRREYLSRKIHDSRGIPEPGKPLQDQIKVHKDSLVDAASLAIMPPLMYPAGRPPGRWGAGARIPERRPGEIHFADRPAYDPSTEKSEAQLRADFNQYNGFVSRETDPTFSALKNQFRVNKRMKGLSKCLKQIWSLWNQFGPEKVFYRVIGLKQETAQEFVRGDIDEQFDFYINFDVQSLDPEHQDAKLEALAKAIATFDKYGQIDSAEALQLALEIIDPNWSERLIQPKEVGSQKIVNETHTMLAQVFAGVDRDIDLNSPPDLVMGVIQGYGQQPDVMQRYQQDEPFRKRLDKIVAQVSMQQKQNLNKKIGRYGA